MSHLVNKSQQQFALVECFVLHRKLVCFGVRIQIIEKLMLITIVI